MELLISRMLGAKTADRSADLLIFMQKPIEWLRLSLLLKYRTLIKVINEGNSNEKNTFYFVLHPSRSSLIFEYWLGTLSEKSFFYKSNAIGKPHAVYTF